MSDTSTTLNAGVGGDVMDESSVVQADGATTVKRARVDVAFSADDARSRLVSKNDPLPVSSASIEESLASIADDLKAIRFILEQTLG